MRITDLIKVDPVFRKRRKAITLIGNIERRQDYYRKNHNSSYSAGHERRSQEQIQQLKDYIYRLDKNEFISDTPSGVKNPVKQTMEQIFTYLPAPGKAQHNDLQQSIVEHMNTIGRETRAKQHRTLLAYELAYRMNQGWFAIFNTLTVAPGEYGNVFNAESTAFSNYIREFNSQTARAAYGSIRAARGKDYHTYLAIVEEGAEHGRLHIHCVHMCKSLPEGSRDPNYGQTIPTYRELGSIKTLWKHGFSSPFMVRYAPNDAYGLAGYRWPYDTRTEKPLEIGSPIRLASYLTKYLTKSYQSNKRAKALWRVRKTQNLGKPLIRELLLTLTPEALLSVATSSSLNPKINNQRIPAPFLRQMALETYQSRYQNSTQQKEHSLTHMGISIHSRPSPLQSLNVSILDSATFNRQSSGTIPTRLINNEGIFKEAHKQITEAAERINAKYFAHSDNAFGTTSIKDHIY